MKKIVRFFLCFVLFVSIIQSAFGQTTYSWNGGSGLWSVSTNWAPNGVPTSIDNVFISADDTYDVTLDIDATVAGLEIGGTTGTQRLVLTSRTLTVNGDVNINTNGGIALHTSTINGTGTLSNSGSVTARTSIIDLDFVNDAYLALTHVCSINGSLSTTTNSRINMNCTTTDNEITIASGFTNHGLIYFTNSGITATGTIDIISGTLINAPDGTIESTSITLYPGSGNKIAAPLDNQGDLTISQGFFIEKESAAHTNSGTMHVKEGGMLNLTQTGTAPSFASSGSLTIDTLAALSISGGEFSHTPGTFSLIGTFTAKNSAIVTFSDAVVNQNVIDIQNSTFHCASTFINLATFNLYYSTMTCAGGIDNQKNMSLNNATVSSDGTLTNSATLTVRTGIIDMDFVNDAYLGLTHTCSINGSFTTTANSRIHINCTTSANEITIANDFTNNGLIYYTNSGTTLRGTINITNGTLINAPDGTIESTSITLYPGSGNKIAAPLDNQGIITISQGFYIDKESAAHTNSGTIHVQPGGVLYLTQTGTQPSFTSSASFAIDSAAAFHISGGEFSHTPGTFTLNGFFSAKNNATVAFSDAIINRSGFDIAASNISCASSFINRNNLRLSSSSSMSVADGIDNQNNIDLNRSSLSGNATMTNSGTLVAFDGAITMDVHNEAYASLSYTTSIDGFLSTTTDSRIHINCTASENNITLSNGFTNHGLIYYTNSGTTLRGAIDMGNDTLINASDGTIQNTSIALYPGYSNKLLATLVNEGQISTSQNFLVQNTGATHINRGNISVNSATLSIQGSPFNNEAPGTIMGKGTLDVSGVSFTNAGSISPGLSPGILNVTGTQHQTESSNINIEIGGTTVDSEYDQLKHTGNVALNGHLNIALIDDFIPDLGDVFDVMTHASSTGQFKGFSGRSTGLGFSFEVEQAANYVRLTAVEPYNILPYIENMIGDVDLVEDFDGQVVADLDTIFVDEDSPFGDSLIYSVSLSENLLEVSLTDSKLNLSSVPDANGTVTVIVFARDTSQYSISDTFNVSILAENDLPLEFSLSEPADKQVLTSIEDIGFKWYSSTDIEDDPLSYELKIVGTTWDTIIQNLTDTSLAYVPASSLDPNTSYEWTVSVSDGQGIVVSPDIFTFTTPFLSSIDDPDLSSEFELKQNYPNPFTQFTTIEFTIPKTEIVSLKIYDVTGQVIDVIKEELLRSGSHSYRLEAGDMNSGVYFYKLEAGEFTQVKRMTLLK